MIHGDFKRLMEAEILPRRVSNPEDTRLDGGRKDGYPKVAGRFRYNNKAWRVADDTHYEPLIIAYEAMKKNPACEPFVEEVTAKGCSLVLTDELQKLRVSSRFKHLYIYQEGE
jgi:hypothetical protein